jgi:hypothetical protein
MRQYLGRERRNRHAWIRHLLVIIVGIGDPVKRRPDAKELEASVILDILLMRASVGAPGFQSPYLRPPPFGAYPRHHRKN